MNWHRYLPWIIGVIFILVVTPFVVLSFYAQPVSDDLWHLTMIQDMGFWKAQRHFYLSFTGRYTASLLTGLNPLLYFGIEGFYLAPLVYLMLTATSIYAAIWMLLDLSFRWISAATTVIFGLWLAFAPSTAETIYWFTGAFVYLTPGWLLLLWLGAFARLIRAQNTSTGGRWLLVACALTLLIAGMVEIVALPFLVALGLLALLAWWRAPELARPLTLLAALALAGCLFSFTAPGNFARLKSQEAPMGLIKSGIFSTAATTYMLITWLSNLVLIAVTGLMIPALVRLSQNPKLPLRPLTRLHPLWLVAIVLILLVMAGFPNYYAEGRPMALRGRTLMYMLFLVGWFSILYVYCARATSSGLVQSLLNRQWTIVWALLLLLGMASDHNLRLRRDLMGQASNNVVQAYRDWLSGDAARYKAQQLSIYRTLKEAGRGGVARIPVQPVQPITIAFFDKTENGMQGRNVAYAAYYRNKAVIEDSTLVVR